MGPSWQLAGSFPCPLALKGKSGFESSSLARPAWAALSVTLSQPLPRAILSPSQGYSGESDPATPWTCQSMRGEEDRDLAAGIRLVQGIALHLEGW